MQPRYPPGKVYDSDQNRRRLNAHAATTGSRLSESHAQLGVSRSSYSGFMKACRPEAGSKSKVYKAAHDFSVNKGREAGILPQPTTHTAGSVAVQVQSKSVYKPSQARHSDATNPTNSPDKFDISSITFPGDSTGSVDIYDTCVPPPTPKRPSAAASPPAKAAAPPP